MALGHLRTQQSHGACVPDDGPELIVATASSDTGAAVLQKVFTEVAAGRGAPLRVTDVVHTTDGDPTGRGIFFLLVAGQYRVVRVGRGDRW
jgi:hypothetical protein